MHIARSLAILTTAGLLLSTAIAQASNRMIVHQRDPVPAATSLKLLDTTFSAFIELIKAIKADRVLAHLQKNSRTDEAANKLDRNMMAFGCKLMNSNGLPRSLNINPTTIEYECRMPIIQITPCYNKGIVTGYLKALQGREDNIDLKLDAVDNKPLEIVFTLTRKNDPRLATVVTIKPAEQ